ncbi:MAG: LemA protein [Parcubacteria group bacterium Gr01-1014_18]|nr:MAG: LemA protein [Parcubacteria group bacterium Greene0416_36]TSC81211.1 MAG: LemA protein [Parcubacteria group bacterium Gr01-1014_18]TSC99208.1 MAG: LemA protein [Parcubacteria group bacterium Greene1014_20]TSD07434.1 MAG: LemA protein [Parcubacteria group bacterium Greene0714_2]
MILSIIVLVILFWSVLSYNGLVRLVTQSDEAWSDIDVQLKRRYDLVPNLVETVKGYAKHESQTLENVIAARNSAMNAHGMQDKASAENALSAGLKSIIALSENYPDLKASGNFLKLQDELSDTENKIQAARRFYNGNVRDLNIKLQVFPDNIIARMFAFTQKEFFELTEPAAKEVVKVQF